MRIFPALFALSVLGLSGLGQLASAEIPPLRVPGPLSPRNASYKIRAHLDEKTHKVQGSLVLSFRNLEPQPTDKLVFHLYLNAFKNDASTFILEAGRQLRGDEMPEHGYGAIDVTKVQIGKEDLTARLLIDDTLMTVPLAKPLGPSSAIEVEISFVSTLPKVFARSGYVDTFHAVSQWFPKIGVFDCQNGCRWRAHQYHGSTEFFADYGSYEVTLDVPASYQVGATGVLQSENQAGDRKHLVYRADDVHDFAFIADPRFVEEKETLKDDTGEIQIRLLTLPGQKAMSGRHFRATKEGLLELQRRFGLYPYSNITVIVPPENAGGASGMEYPTLFLTVNGDVPKGLHVLDGVTAHELAHQYFYGIIGSDEVEEAWLDEGFTEAATGWISDRLFGARCSSLDLLGYCFSAVDQAWLGYRRALRRAPLEMPSYLLPKGAYAALSYSQPTVTLRTLERLLGTTRFEAAMRRYAERNRFRHPRRADLINAFDEGAGEDLRWFWDQALSTTRVLDYEVLRAVTARHNPAYGLWDCPPKPGSPSENPLRARAMVEAQKKACEGKSPGRHEFSQPKNPKEKPPSAPEEHDAEVWIRRTGEFLFPITIRLTFKNGAVSTERWTLTEQEQERELRIKHLTYRKIPSPLLKVEVDPDGILVLDEKRLNNGRLVVQDPGPARRIGARFAGILNLLLWFFGV